MPQRDDFATRLQALIKRRRISEEQYARLLGVSTATINRWINQRRRPGLEHLLRICEVEAVSMDWLTVNKRFVAGISLDRVETILRRIEEHETWGKYDSTEKLKVLAAIYESLKVDNPSREGLRLASSKRK